MQSLADMVRLEIGESLQDLYGGHAIGYHRNDRGDWDPQPGMFLWMMTSNEPSRLQCWLQACRYPPSKPTLSGRSEGSGSSQSPWQPR